METRVAEVGDGIYQFMTYLEDMNFAVNQYLLTGDEPLLFHTGMRGLFPLVAGAVERVMPIASLRWISFGHVEADECGSMNEWLGAAPDATIVQGAIGCMVSIGDMADRPPRPLEPGEKLDIGGHCLEWIDTPHVPHAWEAGVLLDHTTHTLLCGDLFSRTGHYPATTTDDIVTPASEAEDGFASMSLHPASARPFAASLSTTSPHSPSCTAPCSPATAATHSTAWPTTPTAASGAPTRARRSNPRHGEELPERRPYRRSASTWIRCSGVSATGRATPESAFCSEHARTERCPRTRAARFAREGALLRRLSR